ncbi:hypothetical protein [Pseudovibrio sp. WM33]|uniref:hypothetical protein n=1 Tax=Pseudovibrio sp. WM33 TaxID=1735585 RepID=UPI000A53F9C0|nr:hypothetical protein [Pseudovibrio sp. WM33]
MGTFWRTELKQLVDPDGWQAALQASALVAARGNAYLSAICFHKFGTRDVIGSNKIILAGF